MAAAIFMGGSPSTGLSGLWSGVSQYYLVDAESRGGGSLGALQPGGVAPSIAIMTDAGWALSTTHTSNEYADLAYGSVQPATAFSTTPGPAAFAGTNPNGFGFDLAVMGAYPACTWTIKIAVQMSVAGTSGNGQLRVRVFNVDVTGTITELTTSTLVTGTFSISSTAQQNLSVTWAAPAFSMGGEFSTIVFSIGLEILSGAVNAASATCNLVQDPINSVIVPGANLGSPPQLWATGLGFTATWFGNAQSFTTTGPGSENVTFPSMFAFMDHAFIDVGFSDTLNVAAAYPGIQFSDNTDLVGPAAAEIIPINTWFHYGFSMNVVQNTLTLFWKRVGSRGPHKSVQSAGYSGFAGSQGLLIGDLNIGNSSYGAPWQGAFAGFKIWLGNPLTAAQVDAESTQIQPVSRSGLAAFYDFENAGGGVYADKTGHGFNLFPVTASDNTFFSGPTVARQSTPRKLLKSGVSLPNDVIFFSHPF